MDSISDHSNHDNNDSVNDHSKHGNNDSINDFSNHDNRDSVNDHSNQDNNGSVNDDSNRDNMDSINDHSNHGNMPLICSFCGKGFAHLHDLQVHTIEHAVPTRFSCKHCGKGFTEKGRLERHLKIHGDLSCNEGEGSNLPNSTESPSNNLFTCEVCGKRFHSEEHRKRHILEHAANTACFKCECCGKQFLKKSSFIRHIRIHKGTHNVFTCDVCGKDYSRRDHLIRHLKIHAEDRNTDGKRISDVVNEKNKPSHKFFCDICGLGFHSIGKLNEHVVTHQSKHHENTEDQRPFKCKLCGKGSKSKRDLTRHVKIHGDIYFDDTVTMVTDDSESNDTVICVKRQKKRRKRSDVELTINEDQKPFKCKHCGKGFKSKYHLTRHVKIHGDSSDEHDEVDGDSDSLDWEVKTEPKETYVCQECDTSFKSESTLKRHVKTHSQNFGEAVTGVKSNRDQRPFMCNHCGKGFMSKYNLTRHIKIHGDINFGEAELSDVKVRSSKDQRPFKCNHCGKGFTSKYHLTRHIKIHGDTNFGKVVTGDSESYNTVGCVEKPRKCAVRAKSHSRRGRLRSNMKRRNISDSGDSDSSVSVESGDEDLSRNSDDEVTSNNEDNNENSDVEVKSNNEDNNENDDRDDESFFNSAQRELHEKMPFFCELCDKLYASESTYRRHLKTHSENLGLEHVDVKNEETSDNNEHVDVKNEEMSDYLTDENSALDCGESTIDRVSVLSSDNLNIPQNATPQSIREMLKDTPLDYKLFSDLNTHTKSERDVYLNENNSSVSCVSGDSKNSEMLSRSDGSRLLEWNSNITVVPENGSEILDSKSDIRGFNVTETCTVDTTSNRSRDGTSLFENCLEPVPVARQNHDYSSKFRLFVFVCKFCNKFFTDVLTAKKHIQTAHDLQDMQVSNVAESNQIQLNDVPSDNANLVKQSSSSFSCPHCNEKFTRGSNLTLHLKTHSDGAVDFLKCPICSQIYNSLNSLKCHMRNVHECGMISRRCGQCRKIFSSEKKLTKHVRTCRYAKPVKCPVCVKKIYGYTKNLKRHIASHKHELYNSERDSGMAYFMCRICRMKFTKEEFLNLHVKIHADSDDSEEDLDDFATNGGQGATSSGLQENKCKICGKRFIQKKRLEEHNASAHRDKDGDETFLCGTEFQIYKRNGRKPYRCEACRKRFTLRSTYRLHVKSHSRDKLNSCGVCDARFNLKSCLLVHLASHTTKISAQRE